jgi:glycosyltransferase involved in cell wall biosynthesis
LIASAKNLKLVITGRETSYSKFLKELVRSLGIEKEVIFTGFVNEKDLESLYANSLLYVYTSQEEDFGMGIVEALSFGVPVVAWKSSGPKEILRNTDFLVKKGNMKEFSSLIKKFITEIDFNKDSGLKGLNLVREKYSVKKHVDILSKALKSLI